MPTVKAPWGGTFFAPDRDEYVAMISDAQGVAERAAARAWKWMRVPEILSGKVASSAITLGAASGQVLGPDSGYAWSLRRLVVSGLASGATPDVVNLYRNDRFSGPPLWQFNGNNFGYTFSRLEMVLVSGDTLSLQNVGNLTATGVILLSGELTEVPAEMLYKLEHS